MPYKPLKPCLCTGCPELVERGYCQKHKYMQPKDDKETDPFYSSTRWKKFRAYYKKRHPLCELCLEQGLVVATQVVDHVVPIKDGGKKLSSDNVQALCRKCHAKKHSKNT